MLSYPISVRKDGDAYLATSVDFPELTTFGDTKDEALLNAVGALEEAVAARIAHKEAVPRPSQGHNRVALPTLSALKVLLYQRARTMGVSKAELARRMRVHPPQVDRLFDLNHASRLDQIDAAMDCLGARVAVAVEGQRASRPAREKAVPGKPAPTKVAVTKPTASKKPRRTGARRDSAVLAATA